MMKDEEIMKKAVKKEYGKDSKWFFMSNPAKRVIKEAIRLAREDERKKIREELERNGLFQEFWLLGSRKQIIMVFDKRFWDFFWNGERGESQGTTHRGASPLKLPSVAVSGVGNTPAKTPEVSEK